MLRDCGPVRWSPGRRRAEVRDGAAAPRDRAVTRRWEPVTLKLTARQARVLWGVLALFDEVRNADSRVLKTIAAVKRKLE